MKLRTKFLNLFMYCLGLGSLLALVLLIITGTWIGYEIKTQCHKAQNLYGGNCVESLNQLLNDTSQPFLHRNQAIWALGQLAHPSSLPILMNHYTGSIPDKEPLTKTLSQYELQKAITLVKGGINITSFLWRPTLYK